MGKIIFINVYVTNSSGSEIAKKTVLGTINKYGARYKTYGATKASLTLIGYDIYVDIIPLPTGTSTVSFVYYSDDI